jgi:glycosyltransferase involved in cell wall biosynthesis
VPETFAPVDRVAVVIPVHNEERLLARALAGVQAAAASLRRLHPETCVSTVVVLDSCTDNSAAIAMHAAGQDPGMQVLTVDFRNVGRTRNAGIWHVLGGGMDAASGHRLWLANTDADSVVPEGWLTGQVALAAVGADAVLGSVEPDPAGMDPELLRLWRAKHPFIEDHPHIYGANFGIRASAYRRAGGFPGKAVHEDRDLVARLRRLECRVKATDSIRVVTSGRTQARAPHGFSAYLMALALEQVAALEG